MAIFPILKSDAKVQVGDKLRLDGYDTFWTSDEVIERVEISPDGGSTYFTVSKTDPSLRFLDWVYTSATAEGMPNEAIIRVVVLDGMDEVYTTSTIEIEVVSASDDALFSIDEDLKTKEPDILRWVPNGRSSWNHVHRLCQTNILDRLDELRIYKSDGTRWLPSEIVRKDQVRRLSTYMALRMIFSGLSNQVGDVFSEKAAQYKAMELEAQQRNYLILDFGGDLSEVKKDMRTFGMVKR